MRKVIACLIPFLFCTSPCLAWSHGTTAPPNYYVDASAGSDSNAGTQAAPWQTLHKINTTVFPAPGTTINLQNSFSGGDNGLIISPTVAPNGMLTIQSYGTGATITSGNSTACAAITASAISLKNFTCVGGSKTVSSTAGITAAPATSPVQFAGPTISGMTVSQYGGNGIVIKAGGGVLGFANTVISNNVVHDTGDVNGVACIHHSGNNSAYGTINVHYNALIQGNLVYNCDGNTTSGSGSGIFIAETNVGLVQFNVAHDFGAGCTGVSGPTGIWMADATTITMQFNESYNGQKGTCSDGDGFDIEGGTFNSVLQYNYAHDNVGFGILLDAYNDGTVTTWSNNTTRYNISEKSGVAELGIGAAATMTGMNIYNNTLVTSSTSEGLMSTSGSSASGVFENNIIVSQGTLNVLESSAPGSLTIDHNNYTGSTHFSYGGTGYTSFAAYKTGSSQDANSNTSSPTLNGTAGTGGTCYVSGIPAGPQSCPTVYELKTTSVQVGVGVSIASPGSRDYYGGTIPNGSGTGYNIGAYGGTGVP